MSLPICDLDAMYMFLPYSASAPYVSHMDSASHGLPERVRYRDFDLSLERAKTKTKAVSQRVNPWKKIRVNSIRSDSSTDSTSESCSQVDSRRSKTHSSIDSHSSLRDDQEYSLLKYWYYHAQKKPYSAITVQVENLTSEQYDEDDFSGIPDLIEVIRLQSSGPTEAARALRKKLKYGNVHRQLRALTILDGLVQNAGQRFQRVFADEPLLERLRVCGSDPVSDPEVRAKCKALFGQWAVSYKSTPGMEGIVALYRQLPQRKKPVRQQQSKVLRETEADDADDTDDRHDHEPPLTTTSTQATNPTLSRLGPGSSRPTASPSHISAGAVSLSAGPNLLGKSKKDKKNKNQNQKFNLEREKPAVLQAIAGASVASTNLTNSLKFINREQRRVSEDPEIMKRFDVCKQLRRQILRYIQFVESDDFLGGLIHANDELVAALMAYEVLDKSIDDDSDSELEEGKHLSRIHGGAAHGTTNPPTEDLAGLNINHPAAPPRPPRPTSIPMPRRGGKAPVQPESESEEEESEPDAEDDDPFGDSNAAATPAVEKKNYTWREV